jgi:anti-anti-sigma factor
MEMTSRLLEPVIVIRLAGGHLPGAELQEMLSKEVTGLLASGRKRVLIDLEVEFIDSMGLGAIYMEARRVEATGGRLAVYSLDKRMRELFRLVKCGLPLILFDTEEEALCYALYGTRWTLRSSVSSPP